MRSLFRGLPRIALAAFVLACSSLRAQETQPALYVSTTTGQTTFHIGERIALKLTLTSPNDTQYVVAPWSSPRGGEFDRESFDVSPSIGWTDPLATYFSQDFVRTGHGWIAPPLLKSKPIEISVDLNQWVRFDQPGVYQLKVISYRVSDLRNTRWEHNALQSNVIELHIIPSTPEWESAALKAIVPNLVREKPEYQGAMADLRYLSTPAGVDEMTNRMRAGDAYDITGECSMGLIGLPDSMRDVAIASMNKRIAEPDYPISQTFFRTMSMLHVSSGSNAQSIRQQRESYDPTLWQTLFSAVPKKQGAARAQTVQTLLNFGRNNHAAELNLQMNSLLAASLLDLDNRSQIDDLRQHWEMLRSPEILPALQTLAKMPSMNDSHLGPYSREDLKSVAFKRWYELDPAGARTEILAEIGSADPALSAQALRFLPAEALPDIESIWATAFLQTSQQMHERVLGSLLVRFGSGAATSQMIAKLNEQPHDYSCDAHVLALAYLVRFSPDDARPLLRREVAAGEGQCDGSLLRWISEHATGPLMNEVADEALNDANAHTVLDAIQYLTSYGRNVDKEFIWERFVKWTEEWKSKTELLDHPEGGPFADRSDAREGELLGVALLSNQGWLADSALISRVVEMCIGEQMCRQVKNVVANATPPLRMSLPDATNPMGIVAQQPYWLAQHTVWSLDLLDAKVSQYPPGTKFILHSVWTSNGDQRKLEDDVRAIFNRHGMSLEKPTN